MESHPVIALAQKIEIHYGSEITSFWKLSSKKRTKKLYQLIIAAKNSDQLEKELLFKKLFEKTLTEKNDYLWRNEVRVLKEEMEKFLFEHEHRLHAKNNPAYTDWMLMQAFDRIKHKPGVDEKVENLAKNKDVIGSYQYALDADFIKLVNLQYAEEDIKKMMERFPDLIKDCLHLLDNLIAQHLNRINVFIAQYNVYCHQHQNGSAVPLFKSPYKAIFPSNNISDFYYHYALSFTSNFEEQIKNLEQALKDIEPIAAYNKLFESNRMVIQISLGRDLSSNGFFARAHEVFLSIKKDIDAKFVQYKTVFYVNYITNLVKSKMYAEALYTLDHEFVTENLLYRNMLLQNRLLCYLYLRDTENLATYISYDLDSAPFPQNYMLKLIKSVYFYFVKEYDVALQIVSNLLQTKDASDRMQHYQPIALLYKKFYTTVQKNTFQKKWSAADIQSIKNEVEDIENNTLTEVKLVSVFLWIKDEIESVVG